MLAVVSPAKALDFSPAPADLPATEPRLFDQTVMLAKTTRGLSKGKVAALMDLSDKLAALNVERFRAFSAEQDRSNAKQAVLAFAGDTYRGLDAATMTADDLAWAQDRLRMLSGLYGLLRPFDLIQPYRLEMGTRLENPAGRDLYAFWKETLTRELDRAVAASGSPVLVNLASNEYFKAIDTKRLEARVITPVFKDEKNGKLKVISFYAKKARGLMAAWMIRERLDDPEGLKDFDVAGYAYNASLSEGDTLVFTRTEGAA